MDTIITLFGLPLTRYGLLCGIALLATLVVAGVCCRKKHIAYDALIRMAVIAVPLALLLGRLVYVLACYDYYLNDLEYPLFALRFWDGGYAMTGVYLALVLAAYMTERRCRVPHGDMLDALAPAMPVGLLLARIAESGTGLGEGKFVEGDAPAWMVIDSGLGECYAVFRLEAAMALVLLTVLLVWMRMCLSRERGDALLMFTLLYGCMQVVLESLRDDGHMEVHMGVHVQEVLSAVMVLAVLGVWTARALKRGACGKPLAAGVWLVAIAAVALAVVAEFGVDRWDSKLLAYGIMIACLALLLALSAIMRRIGCRKEGCPHGA